MRVRRWIGLFAFLLVAALAAGQQTSAGAGTAGIIGAVVDPQDALIPGASVEVTGDNVANHTIKANEVGAFALNGLPAGGTLHITIKATGFGDWHSDAIVLAPGEMRDLNTIKLVVATTIIEVAAAAPEKVAVEQVQTAERQRLFGILPNFYVTYDTRFVPLSTKLKYQLAFRTATDVATFLGAGFLAGIDQASDVAPHYEQGASGYGKRLGAAYAGASIDIVLGGAIFPTLFHQDPRYFYQGTGTKKSRMLHAISSPFVAKGDNGRWQMNISSIGGDLGASAMTNLYYPESDRGGGLVVKGFLEATGARIASSVLQEFVFRKLTTNSVHNSHNSKARIVP